MQQWSKQVDQKKPSAHDQDLIVERRQQQRHEAPTGGWTRNVPVGGSQKQTNDSSRTWKKGFDSRSHKKIPSMQIMEGDEDDPDQQPEGQENPDEEASEFAMISAFMQMNDARGKHNVARRSATARVR